MLISVIRLSREAVRVVSLIGFLGAMLAGGPAAARGIAIDQVQPASIHPCTLGGACSPNDFNQTYDYNFIGGDPGPPTDAFNLGIFNKIYVYDDGVISIGNPLPSTASLAGGLASLGTDYIAAGFADLAHDNSSGDFQVVGSVDPVFTPDGTALVAQTVNVEWIFDTPSGSSAILGLTLIDLSNIAPGEIFVSLDSGAGSTTWFGTNYANALCDQQCEDGITQNGFGVEGVYLPNGAEVATGLSVAPAAVACPESLPTTITDAFGYGGFCFNTNIGAIGSSPVPEPRDWALAVVGFFLLGWQLRSARPARPVRV